jgi:predicted DNA-binding transcriptional regulator AlpA
MQVKSSIRAENRAQRAQVAVASFDSLPDCSFVSLPVVQLLFGCSAPTVWRMSRDGRLPKPEKIGRMTRWRVGALRRASLARGAQE